jgi:hypothetical protein
MKLTIAKMASLFAVGVLTASGSLVHAGGSLDLSLSDDNVRLAYDATQLSTGMHINAALLHNSSDGDIISGGLHVVDVRNNQNDLYIGVGGNAYAVIVDNEKDGVEDANGAAIGVGGFFRYSMPFNRNLALAGYVYYAPPVISFSEVENMVDSDIRIQYNLLPTAHLYTGFRYTSIQFENANSRYKLGEGLHLGFKLDF